MADSEEFNYNFLVIEAYEGASDRFRLGQRGLISGDPDTLAERELANLTARSHHAVRNDGWAGAGLLEFRVNQNAIKVIWKNKDGTTNEEMQELWKKFANNPALDGYGTLANIQDSWNSGLFSPGEIFTRMIAKKRADIKVPLYLQLIEAEYLDPLYKDKEKNIRNGIQFKEAKPFIYHFNKTRSSTFFTNSEKVPVKAEDVIHIFDRTRANQWRGVPKLSPTLMSLYELSDLVDATVNKQKAAQAIAWIIENSSVAASTAVGTTSTVTKTNPDGTKINTRILKTVAGGAHYINKGESIKLLQGTDIGDNVDKLIKSEVQKIASNIGINYEFLTGDLSGISFSALKFVVTEMRKKAEFIYNMVTIPLGLAKVCDRFKFLVSITNPRISSKVEPYYQFPKRMDLDQLNTAKADFLEITSNLDTLENKLSERNLTMDDIAQDKKNRKDKDLEIEANPSLTNQTTNVEPNSNSTGT